MTAASTDIASTASVRWLDWQVDADAITELRRLVYVDEQSIDDDIVHHSHDSSGIHLGAVADGVLVALVSAWIFQTGDPHLDDLGLERVDGVTIQVGKRLERREVRRSGLSEDMTAWLVRQAYETYLPSRLMLILQGVHKTLETVYERTFLVHRHSAHGLPTDPRILMEGSGPDRLDAIYRRMRHMTTATTRIDNRRPSLVKHLADTGRTDQIGYERLDRENLYEAPLDLSAELPRLRHQSRLLAAVQAPILDGIAFPDATADPRTVVDLGTGPGDYLALTARHRKFAGYTVVGIEPSPRMRAIAHTDHPELTVTDGSAYRTGLPTGSVDVVTAQFVFIHLRNVDLALMEISRILAPGGVFHVVDVNDDGFVGPKAISDVVAAHASTHEGDRSVLSTLADRAEHFGLEVVALTHTPIHNTAREGIDIRDGAVHLDRAVAWSMLEFIGQRDATRELFESARTHYRDHDPRISFRIDSITFAARIPTE